MFMQTKREIRRLIGFSGACLSLHFLLHGMRAGSAGFIRPATVYALGYDTGLALGRLLLLAWLLASLVCIFKATRNSR